MTMGETEKYQAVEGLWEASQRRFEGALPVNKNANATDIDALAASELNKLSLNERERRLQELHGIVEENIEETPEFIDEKLAAMEIAIQNITEKSAYLEALSMNRSYVEDPKFRLMFLRSDRYDPERAAARIVLFMEKKRKIFGAHSMVRSLTLKDFDDDDMYTLRVGQLQVLPVRDRAGRMIIVDTHMTGPKLYSTDMSCLRGYIYRIMNIVEDEDTQKHGIVNLMYYMGAPRLSEKRDEEFQAEIVECDRWLPFRSAAIHMCCSSPILKFFYHVMKALSVPDKRSVMRMHEGTNIEVQYQLLSFGIPVDAMGIDSDGNMKTTTHRKWISRQQRKERNIEMYGNNFGRIDFPTHRDILCGKGRTRQDHLPNVRLRHWIQQILGNQTSLSRDRKAELCQEVLSHVVNERKGRFLMKDSDDWWIVSSPKEAHEKVSKMIANILYSSKQQQRRQQLMGDEENGNRSNLFSGNKPAAKRQRLQTEGDAPCIDNPCKPWLPRHDFSGFPTGMTKADPQ